MNIKIWTMVIVAMLALCPSCSKSMDKWSPAVDPLKGWNRWGEHDVKHSPLDKAIKDDYQNYLKKHEPNYFSVEGATFYEDGTGLHAVQITVGRNGNYTFYIFMYDKHDARTKIMRFAKGGYAC